MQYIAAMVVGLAFLLLLLGMATGRVRASSCCAPVDPSKDLRMRGAFEDNQSRPTSRTPAGEAPRAEAGG